MNMADRIVDTIWDSSERVEDEAVASSVVVAKGLKVSFGRY